MIYIQTRLSTVYLAHLTAQIRYCDDFQTSSQITQSNFLKITIDSVPKLEDIEIPNNALRVVTPKG